MRRAPVLALVVPIALALAGCGGSETTTGADTGSSSPGLGDEVGATDGGDDAALPGDACGLLDPADVVALLGEEAPATEGVSSLAEGTPQFVSCSWGSLVDDAGLVSVAVSVPSGTAGVDYLTTLAGGLGGDSSPVDVGEEGELLDVFVMPGGGGVGRSVMFGQGGLTVVVARSGEDVDTAALESAATQVATRL